ncbi:MAG: flippase-like domain-containing protein [Deltaproteobacteria bacterium]|nr:flippase-like domain-containing protein [Deltaproteobacteria bacterium]
MAKRSLFYKSIGFFTAIFASFITLSIFFSQKTLKNFIDFLAAAEPKLIWAFLLLHLLAAVFRSFRYRLVLENIVSAAQLPTRGTLLLVTLVRNAFADFLPMRLGEGVYFFMLNRLGVRIITCASSFGVCLALDLLVLAFMFLLVIGGFTLFSDFNFPQSFNNQHILLFIFILILLSLLIYYADIIGRKFLNLVEKKISKSLKGKTFLQRFFGLIDDLIFDLEQLRQRGHYYNLILLTIGLRACKYVGLYMLLLALVSQYQFRAAQLPFPYLFFAFITAEASSSLPISGIMGFGVSQGVWVGVLAALGVELPEKLSVALGVHVISQVVAYSLGILSLFSFGLLMLRKRRSELNK